MADSTINGLTALSGANVDNTADQFAIWDNSDNTTKKITRTEVLTGIPAGTVSAPAISPTGDSNTGVWFSAADQITLVTGGSPRLSVSDVGQLLLNRTGNAGAPTICSSSDGNTGLYFPAADTLGLATGGVDRVRVDSAGRVGIGTASPTSFNPLATPSLAIVGASSNTGIGNLNVWSNDTGGAADLGGNIALGGDDGVTAARTYAEIRGRKENATSGNYASYLSFATRANLGSITERMRIDSAGQVGIGKTPSLGLLDVNGDAYFNTVRVGLGGGAVASNTVVGNGAMAATATGALNSAFGFQALNALTSGTQNSAVGHFALVSTTTGSYNTAVGKSALAVNSTGSQNTAIGLSALGSNTASDNTAVGFQALTANTSGTGNTAVGKSALNVLSTGSFNTAVGWEALKLNTASDNTACGYNALAINTSGTNNVAVGRNALVSNTTTSQSTAIGRSALAACTAADNTALGYSAGSALTTGANNTIIGSLAAASAVTGTGQIVIGKGVTGTANNRITVGITTNIAELDLDGVDTSWAASSDERLKKNVADYAAGLDVITALRPVTYQWRSRKEVPTELTNYYADSDEPVHGDASKTYHGFIAQEVKAVLDANPSVPNGQHLWEQRDDGVQTLAPADLVPILVNAIKQLNAEVQALKNA